MNSNKKRSFQQAFDEYPLHDAHNFLSLPDLNYELKQTKESPLSSNLPILEPLTLIYSHLPQKPEHKETAAERKKKSRSKIAQKHIRSFFLDTNLTDFNPNKIKPHDGGEQIFECNECHSLNWIGEKLKNESRKTTQNFQFAVKMGKLNYNQCLNHLQH